jgi:hypothetical protein
VSGGQIAALIAAGFFAVGMCAVVFVLFRLAGLISHANRILTDYSDRAGTLIERAQAAVDRTNEQLARTDSITASMDEVTANMADLSGHVSALAGLARSISAGFGTPLLRVSAFVFGIHRAVALRRPARAVTAARPEPAMLAHRKPAAGGGPDAVRGGHPAGLRRALPAQRGRAPSGRRSEARH